VRETAIEDLLLNPPEEFVPLLHKLLIFRSSETIFPELLKVMGPENTVKFLKEFGGKDIHIPSWRMVSGIVQDSYLLYKVLSNGTYSQRTKILKELEMTFGMPLDHLIGRAESLQRLIEDFDLKKS